MCSFSRFLLSVERALLLLLLKRQILLLLYFFILSRLAPRARLSSRVDDDDDIKKRDKKSADRYIHNKKKGPLFPSHPTARHGRGYPVSSFNSMVANYGVITIIDAKTHTPTHASVSFIHCSGRHPLVIPPTRPTRLTMQLDDLAKTKTNAKVLSDALLFLHERHKLCWDLLKFFYLQFCLMPIIHRNMIIIDPTTVNVY